MSEGARLPKVGWRSQPAEREKLLARPESATPAPVPSVTSTSLAIAW